MDCKQSAAIDLDAVRTARGDLAMLARMFPQLATATARARLAAVIHDQEANMSKRVDPSAPPQTEAPTIAVRVTREMLDALDAEAARLEALMPGNPVSRSMALRSILARVARGELVAAAGPVAVPPVVASAPPVALEVRVPAASAKPAVPRKHVPNDLRARFQSASEADPERVNRRAAREALGCSEATVRRWDNGTKELSPEHAAALATWLDELGR